MNSHTFKTNDFLYPDDAIKICTRMGWAPEQNSKTFTITYPESDASLVQFIFDYFM